MSNVVRLVRDLEGYLQEECGAQLRLARILGAQSERLLHGKPQDITSSTGNLENEARSLSERASRRERLLRAFASEWQISPRALVMSSILERLGSLGLRAGRLRKELKRAAEHAALQSRRLAAVANHQQRVVTDIVEAVLCQSAGAAGRGGLLDAEA